MDRIQDLCLFVYQVVSLFIRFSRFQSVLNEHGEQHNGQGLFAIINDIG